MPRNLPAPLGGPKVELTEPAHLVGEFVSRSSWGLVLFGAILTVGGVAGAGAAIYDVSTGRATVGGLYDAELEKTHAYALSCCSFRAFSSCGSMVPFVRRGTPFRVESDGSVAVRARDSWEPMLKYQYPTDGTTITFAPPSDGDLQRVRSARRVRQT